jgi:hypothetical protein
MHQIPLHHKRDVPLTKAQKTARAEHAMHMMQLNHEGFRKPKTSPKRMMRARGGEYMSIAEKTAVAADMMEPYKPVAAEVRANRHAGVAGKTGSERKAYARQRQSGGTVH